MLTTAKLKKNMLYYFSSDLQGNKMDIKLTKHDKRYIEGTDDVYSIMQRVLLRDNKIDQEKEHLWMIGMN